MATRKVTHRDGAPVRRSTSPRRRRSPPNRRTRATATPAENADEVAEADALIPEVDALPAEQIAERVGDDDVQAALETSASVQIPSA